MSRLRSGASNAAGIDFLSQGLLGVQSKSYRDFEGNTVHYSLLSIQRVNSHQNQRRVYPNLKSSQKRRFLSLETYCNFGQFLQVTWNPPTSYCLRCFINFQKTTYVSFKGSHYTISLNILFSRLSILYIFYFPLKAICFLHSLPPPKSSQSTALSVKFSTVSQWLCRVKMLSSVVM